MRDFHRYGWWLIPFDLTIIRTFGTSILRLASVSPCGIYVEMIIPDSSACLAALAIAIVFQAADWMASSGWVSLETMTMEAGTEGPM